MYQTDLAAASLHLSGRLFMLDSIEVSPGFTQSSLLLAVCFCNDFFPWESFSSTYSCFLPFFSPPRVVLGPSHKMVCFSLFAGRGFVTDGVCLKKNTSYHLTTPRFLFLPPPPPSFSHLPARNVWDETCRTQSSPREKMRLRRDRRGEEAASSSWGSLSRSRPGRLLKEKE